MTGEKSKIPQALDAEGKELFQRRQYLTAAGRFAAAAEAYELKKDALNAAEMRNNRSVALLQGKKAQEALESARGTDAIFAAAGDLRRQGMALANQAAALDALKRITEAGEVYEEAARILEKAGEDQMRADVMRAISALHARKGKGMDALIAMQDGLSGVEKPTWKQRLLKSILRLRFW